MDLQATMERVRLAQERYASYSQERADEIFRAVVVMAGKYEECKRIFGERGADEP